MTMQKDIFLDGEGDKWLDRNRERLGQYDPVTNLIDEMAIKPKNVLEVGCADGWRLAKLRDKFGCSVMGVDPSRKAVAACGDRRVPAWQMTASTLPVPHTGTKYDMIIYGFCLYLTDPKDWLNIAANADLLLEDNGHIVIHDFDPLDGPYARQYKHSEGVMAYHIDFAQLWFGNPLYSMARRVIADRVDMVTIIKKQPVKSIRVLA